MSSLYKYPDIPDNFQITDNDQPPFTARGLGIYSPVESNHFFKRPFISMKECAY